MNQFIELLNTYLTAHRSAARSGTSEYVTTSEEAYHALLAHVEALSNAALTVAAANQKPATTAGKLEPSTLQDVLKYARKAFLAELTKGYKLEEIPGRDTTHGVEVTSQYASTIVPEGNVLYPLLANIARADP